jgi:excisionase family DNA binding protein
MATVAFKQKAKARKQVAPATATPKRLAPKRQKDRDSSHSEGGEERIKQLYEAFRRGNAKLVSPDGNVRLLPGSLNSFLVELTGQLNQGKSVTIIRNQATLTTLEAANMLGVSRQFLVNLLEKGEIAHHMVGTHRRVYAQDLFRYKAVRDKGRHKLLRDLAIAEAKEGLYEIKPSSIDAR